MAAPPNVLLLIFLEFGILRLPSANPNCGMTHVCDSFRIYTLWVEGTVVRMRYYLPQEIAALSSMKKLGQCVQALALRLFIISVLEPFFMVLAGIVHV